MNLLTEKTIIDRIKSIILDLNILIESLECECKSKHKKFGTNNKFSLNQKYQITCIRNKIDDFRAKDSIIKEAVKDDFSLITVSDAFDMISLLSKCATW